MIALLSDVRIALLSLVEHRRRGLFLGGAIGGVTMLLVLLTALSTGVRSTLVDTATTLSTGHVNVGGFFKVTGAMAMPAVTHASEVLALTRKAVPELDSVVQRGWGWAKVVSENSSVQADILGIDIASERRLKQLLNLVDGSLAGLEQANTILLFKEQADKLGVRVGDALTISAQTNRGVNNTIDCTVAAIARDIGVLSKGQVYVPTASLRELYQYKPDTTGAIQLYLRPVAVDDAAAVAARVRTVLKDAGYGVMEPDDRPFWTKFGSVSRQAWTGQKLDVSTWQGELSYLMWTLAAIDGLSYLLVMILMFIVVAGIMNTMWVTIRERTREIGALRAIGMQRLNVVRMLLLESLFLGLASTLAGASLGASVAVIVTNARLELPLAVQLFLMSDHLRMVAEPAAVLQSVLLLTAVSGLAAVQPALRAARLQPVDAMSHFG